MRERSLRGADVTRATEGLIHPSQVSRWLNGHARPGLGASAHLAAALDLPHAEVLAAMAGAPTEPEPDPDAPADGVAVEVGFDGDRWRRDIDGQLLVARQLSDLLDENEQPVLDDDISSDHVAAAANRYRDASARIEAATADRAAALAELVDAGMTAHDLAALIGVSPRSVQQRVAGHTRRHGKRVRQG